MMRDVNQSVTGDYAPQMYTMKRSLRDISFVVLLAVVFCGLLLCYNLATSDNTTSPKDITYYNITVIDNRREVTKRSPTTSSCGDLNSTPVCCDTDGTSMCCDANATRLCGDVNGTRLCDYRSHDGVDNWQTVLRGVSYVYSAHLDPVGTNTQSRIQILGTLRHSALIQHEDNVVLFYCRVWTRSLDGHQVQVVTVPITDIKRQASIRE